MEIVSAVSTNLFVGSEAEPRQVVRVVVRGTEPAGREPARVTVEADGVRSVEAVRVGPLARGEEARLEVGLAVDASAAAGATLRAEVVVEAGQQTSRLSFDFVVAEPGWRLFMISHFHYDPVWWNTQSAYTETWGTAIQYRFAFQEPGLALVKAHLETARRDPDYRFVLAELDYLKPYWDAYPEDREYIRQLFAEDRLELVGGTYNEPNTNLTSAESTIRNAIYGVGYQRDVLGGSPASAWQLDAFGHDPQFPGIMADAGISSSSWARGPFHEWGPHWVRGPARMPFPELAAAPLPEMQFPTEFDWVAPSGRSLLTCFMADHYSAGWWMDAATTLEQAEAEVHALFTDLAPLAATKNVLLPVGTDYSPPNKWLTAIYRDWNSRYVWPKFLPAIPRQFFDAVREERARTGRGFSPQSRDMNPIYTGKDVSFIDTKQAQRVAENTLLGAEKFATIAALLGARFPSEAIDKAWRQLLFGAHHDGITGSESDQVYLDLLGGWREAVELGQSTLDAALGYIGGRIDTTGDGLALTVFNPLSWPRSDLVRASVELPDDWPEGIELLDDAGGSVPLLLEDAARRDDGGLVSASVAFVARDIPGTGYRTYRIRRSSTPIETEAWTNVDGTTIENDAFEVTVDPDRGGAIVSLIEKRTGKQLVQPGRVANELLAYREYPNHPLFNEGPWHLTPSGSSVSSIESPVTVTVEESAIGRRIRIEGPFEKCVRRQEIGLWDGLDRVDMRTSLDEYTGHDLLFRVRFPATVEGGAPVSEVGNAVVGRPYGWPNIDTGKVPFTLDHPAYNWFALGSTARVELTGARSNADAQPGEPRSGVAIGIAEVVGLDLPAHDDAVRQLVVALVRAGVTSTLSRADGHRYGVLHIDSNVPDVRIAIGRPAESSFVAALLAAAEPGYGAELDRQLAATGRARVWVPATRPRGRAGEDIPDVRAVRALPVLVVAGADEAETVAAIEAVVADLEDAAILVEQPAELDGSTGHLEDYTVAILNRGMPGFAVETDGTMYLSLMRSCSGWPSGVWIDPPRRSAPDGSNFQFQHWSHSFEYALVANAGDWRAGEIVRAGHAYGSPLIARLFEPHDGDLPDAIGFLEVEPASVVATALKPAGDPMARMASPEVDPAEGLVVRLYESAGRATEATIRSRWPLQDAAVTNLLEEPSRPAETRDGAVSLRLDPNEITTVRARPRVEPSSAAPVRLVPSIETVQPVFADYWLHNKGAAPLGYQPLAVQIQPSLVAGSGPFRLPISVASERTDEAVGGSLKLVVPGGWQVSPAERTFRLAPGAHLVFEATVTPAAGTAAGRYFVAARVSGSDGQIDEDVATVDYREPGDGRDPGRFAIERSASLAQAVQRSLARLGPVQSSAPLAEALPETLGGELEASLLETGIALEAGQRGTLRVRLRNVVAGEIRGEAQLISPHETWAFLRPWTQGFAIAPGEETILSYAIDPPAGFPGGGYWALVKLMYFGRLFYTESVPITIAAAATVGTKLTAARRA